jgi:hypothetical protein
MLLYMVLVTGWYTQWVLSSFHQLINVTGTFLIRPSEKTHFQLIKNDKFDANNCITLLQFTTTFNYSCNANFASKINTKLIHLNIQLSVLINQ